MQYVGTDEAGSDFYLLEDYEIGEMFLTEDRGSHVTRMYVVYDPEGEAAGVINELSEYEDSPPFMIFIYGVPVERVDEHATHEYTSEIPPGLLYELENYLLWDQLTELEREERVASALSGVNYDS